MNDAVWNHAVFSKNRDRLLTSDVAQQFFAEVNKQARRFMSDEHFRAFSEKSRYSFVDNNPYSLASSCSRISRVGFISQL
jgi:hypothetical protein